VSSGKQTDANLCKWGKWRLGGWLAWRAPLVGAGLAVLEVALVRLAGSPGRQLEVLRQLGEAGADPLASLLALLALAAEGLAGYLLAVLGLRLLAMVPGVVGRLAAGATALATSATVRRMLDLLVGGALSAQATLTPLPARAAAAPPPVAAGRVDPTAAPLPSPRPPLAGGRRSPARGRRPAAGARRGGLVANRCGAVGGRGALAVVAGARRARPGPDPSRLPPARASLPTRPPMREPTVGFGSVGPAASGAVVPEANPPS
jgi:hypothetical protein